MTMTKSRKVMAQLSPAEIVAKTAGEDFERFFDEAERDWRESFKRLKTIFRKGDTDRVVSYTQEQHSATLAQLAHFSALTKLLTFSLAKALARLDALESDQKKSKAAPLPYAGAWKQGQETQPGQFITFQGSIWHCNKKTLSRPGDDPSAFTLAVKSGRDGKDARP